jgi:hypothetical protein
MKYEHESLRAKMRALIRDSDLCLDMIRFSFDDALSDVIAEREEAAKLRECELRDSLRGESP